MTPEVAVLKKMQEEQIIAPAPTAGLPAGVGQLAQTDHRRYCGFAIQ